jgi:hypothetical protein
MRKVYRLIVALVAASLLQACAAATPVAFGPYLQNVTQTETTVCWITVEGEAAVQAAGQEKLTGQAYREHEIRFTGLKSGTTYSYDVTPDGVPGGTGTFTTAPAGPDASFTFVAYGDTRSRPDVHANSAEYGAKCIETEVLEKYGGELFLVPKEDIPLSTSAIEAKIKSGK